MRIIADYGVFCANYGNDRLVLIIDEYPYAANANKSLGSILQHLIDYGFKNSNMFFVLCGSSVSFMENNVLGECKWKDHISQAKVLRLLADRANYFSDYETHRWLFAKDAGTDGQADRVVTVEDLFE